MKTVPGTSEEFEIGVRIHQGSALSLLLIIIIMEEERGEAQWELLDANGLVVNVEAAEVKSLINGRKEWKRDLDINIEKNKIHGDWEWCKRERKKRKIFIWMGLEERF